MAQEPVDRVGAEACRVDDPAGSHVALGGVQGRRVVAHVDAGHGVFEQDRRPALPGVRGQGEVGGPCADDGLVGNRQASEHAFAQIGQDLVHLVRVHDVAVLVPVGLGLFLQARQGVELFLVPGHQHGTGVLDGDAGGLGVVAQQVVAASHEPGLQGARFRVEACVQDGGVCLAGSVSDVVAGFEQRHGDVVAGQFACDGRADNASSDHHDVEDLGVRTVGVGVMSGLPWWHTPRRPVPMWCGTPGPGLRTSGVRRRSPAASRRRPLRG